MMSMVLAGAFAAVLGSLAACFVQWLILGRVHVIGTTMAGVAAALVTMHGMSRKSK